MNSIKEACEDTFELLRTNTNIFLLLWQLAALDREDGVNLFDTLPLEASYPERLVKYTLATSFHM